jgi:hypothetical protein
MKEMVRSTSKRASRTHLQEGFCEATKQCNMLKGALVKFNIFHFDALSLRRGATVSLEQQLVIQAQLQLRHTA